MAISRVHILKFLELVSSQLDHFCMLHCHNAKRQFGFDIQKVAVGTCSVRMQSMSHVSNNACTAGPRFMDKTPKPWLHIILLNEFFILKYAHGCQLSVKKEVLTKIFCKTHNSLQHSTS
jgi:hypothetical protein